MISYKTIVNIRQFIYKIKLFHDCAYTMLRADGAFIKGKEELLKDHFIVIIIINVNKKLWMVVNFLSVIQ